MNPSEDFVYRVCQKSFLSLWSYARPRGRKGKELCDILVVCDPYVIIFSVKDIGLGKSGEISVDWKRWTKAAVEESRKQIYGAERWIRSASHVVRSDGTQALAFPTPSERWIFRVAVALGGKDQVPVATGDLSKGYVHIFDEAAFNIVLHELDTITDFVNYLRAKEEMATQGTRMLCRGEENVLALYLRNGLKFPKSPDQIIIDDDLWGPLQQEHSYLAKKQADKVSYVWDGLIEVVCADTLEGRLEFGDLTEAEQALRVMAREDRYSRRLLGRAFQEFIETGVAKKIRSRMIASESGIVYVFLACPHGTEREHRKRELVLRCFVARGRYQDRETVVGIATEQHDRCKGSSLDLAYLRIPDWNQERQQMMEKIQAELGYFHKPIVTALSEPEYPVIGGVIGGGSDGVKLAS